MIHLRYIRKGTKRELSYTSCRLHASCLPLAGGSQEGFHSRTGDGWPLNESEGKNRVSMGSEINISKIYK